MKKQTIQKEMPGLKKQTFLVSAAKTMYFDFFMIWPKFQYACLAPSPYNLSLLLNTSLLFLIINNPCTQLKLLHSFNQIHNLHNW